jgi:AraC-like DNA-binding protein
MTALHLGIGKLVARFLPGRPGQPSTHARTSRDDEFLARVKSGVELHCEDPRFTTSSAAAELAMSRMHLNRRLRALTGKSTHEYILEVRLENARNLLVHTGVPVGTISSRVGFRSPSHFARAFRMRFGVPPSRFRNLVSNGGDAPAQDYRS